MFERFTDRARRVVVLAQEEARRLDHNHIGTEHLLLGLLREGDGVAARALSALHISLDQARLEIEGIIGRGRRPSSDHIPFTPRAKKVLELSLREAQQLGHAYIGTEHLLLGLLREGEGVAAQVLVTLGADLNRVRQQVIQLLHGQPEEPAAEPGPVASQVHPVGTRAQLGDVLDRLGEVLSRLDGVDRRLSGIERRLGLDAGEPRTSREPGPGDGTPGTGTPGTGTPGTGTPGTGTPGDETPGSEQAG